MKPSYAPSIWSDPDHIYPEIPSPRGAPSHTVHMPNTDAGLRIALQIINAKGGLLGTRGAPTKYQVEKELEELANDFLRKGGKIVRKAKDKFSIEQRQTARDVLRELGLI